MFKAMVRHVAALESSVASALSSAMTTESSTTNALSSSSSSLSPWHPLSVDGDPALSPHPWLVYKNPDNFSVCPCPIDASRPCTGSGSGTPPSSCDPDATVLRLVLRWSKVVAIKVARNYHAWPVVLVVIPLVIGFVLGYWMGARRRSAQDEKRNVKREPRPEKRQDCRRTARWSSATTERIARHCIPKWFASRIPTETQGRRVPMSMTVQPSAPTTPMERSRSSSYCVGDDEGDDEEARDERAREYLRSEEGAQPESGVDAARVPKHVAIIMDGNRRHGRRYRGSATSGHYDGSRKLLQVAKWCIAERIETLTVYAFSTENWNRDPSEVAALMSIFTKYCEELRVEAIGRNIRVRVLSSDESRIPHHVKRGLDRLQDDTASCTGGLQMNICLSYGGRGEIVGACRALAQRTARGELSPDDITEREFQQELLTSHCPDPDVLIRTSGEFRLSNFLLWQLAYTELFFVDKNWPEIEKSDLIRVIRCFADGRSRRFGQ